MLFQLLFSSKSIQNILILWAIVAPFASASIRPVVNRLNQDTTVYYGLIYGLVFCAFSWPYTYYGILTTFPLPSPWRSNFFFTSSTISDSVPSLVFVLQSAHTHTPKKSLAALLYDFDPVWTGGNLSIQLSLEVGLEEGWLFVPSLHCPTFEGQLAAWSWRILFRFPVLQTAPEHYLTMAC